MANTHLRVDDGLAEATRAAGGFGEDVPLTRVARWAMASAAGWPDAACRMAAGPGKDADRQEDVTDE
jgi:hypothetical protein